MSKPSKRPYSATKLCKTPCLSNSPKRNRNSNKLFSSLSLNSNSRNRSMKNNWTKSQFSSSKKMTQSLLSTRKSGSSKKLSRTKTLKYPASPNVCKLSNKIMSKSWKVKFSKFNRKSTRLKRAIANWVKPSHNSIRKSFLTPHTSRSWNPNCKKKTKLCRNSTRNCPPSKSKKSP